MGIGEIFIFLFISAIFAGGIFVGYKLYKLNMKDHIKKKERNEKIRAKKKIQKD
tara:strand:- start:458 stop:619 length:162 start_codon:yes stop_codon:yes gene_type:complete